MSKFSISAVTTRTLSKEELIKIVEENFKDCHPRDGIAQVTTCVTRDEEDYTKKTVTQSITFAKVLDC